VKRITLVFCLSVFCLFAVMQQGCACARIASGDKAGVSGRAVVPVAEDSTYVSQMHQVEAQTETTTPMPSTVQIAKQDTSSKAKAKKPDKSASNQKSFDMDALIEQIKQSHAIGMFTKLALRSDALDMIDLIKAYRQKANSMSLDEVRARFDGLFLKVLALLDDDPVLSRKISMSREGIWNSLLEVKA